ncbi:benzoate/H(+) symporter BenE family transporter [Pseudoalteromonas prydzensis]|uniref:Benzoate/H(+) symporter BenE family transporter n=1 Tax=Pseudoalteromonas prydzensis TaxID=182141 RepID=A0ABR9FG35_9GAMM|nr:benzoate/H(+) symporter BenE family transporter [Pseudoalteromonas prydzensis]MBE0379831.1 benzoate membrane transport protein [Pseudoalteromonas prydzensis ACAM 620]MBE0455917.1 benzoate/H(+) symporter BenE family transporter [Pseudoalteromonas prydzensis]
MQLSNQLLNRLTAGLVAVIIGFTSSIALIYQVVIVLGGTAELVASWVLMLGLAMGVTSIGLSYYYKIPILIAWSTTGAALLITSAQGYSLNQAVGAFMFSALLVFISGITGWFAKIMERIPSQIACAMLAGVLVTFGIDVFNFMSETPLLIGVMVLVYLVCKRLIPRFTMLMVLIAGFVMAGVTGQIDTSSWHWKMSEFAFISPEFNLQAMISVGIPLYIVTMTSQNLPGIAVLKAHNYPAPVSAALNVTGLTNILIAPFGGYAINLAAITAAICMSEDADSNPNKRYWASIAGGGFYILMAIGAATLVGLVASLPQALILALAGIALFTTIASSLQQALSDSYYTEAAMITFLVTASDLTLFSVGSAFWGILAGGLTLWLIPRK